MSVDTISNMLSAIKNASRVGKESLEVPHTKVCESIAKVLSKNEFLGDIKSFKDKETGFKRLNIELLNDEDGVSIITDLKRVSKPGRRVYKPYEELGRVYGGFGISVVSTSRGIMTGSEARAKKLGGEVICYIW